MKKLKVVQIGIGHDHACSGFNSILAQSDVFEVLGFAVPQEELECGLWEDRIRYYRNELGIPYYTVEEILKLNCAEAALIETEDLYLTKYALKAANAGLHIYMDKPGGTDLALFEELVKTVKEKNLIFNAGYMYRFNPAVLDAKERIKRGELGEIFCIEAHMDCDSGKEKREWLGKFPGGMMFYLGCHLVDLIYEFLGEPDEVIPLNAVTGICGVTSTDFGMAAYRYKNGVSFVKTCAAEIGGYMRRQLVICGTKGTLELNPIEYVIGEIGRDWLYTDYRFTPAGLGWHHKEHMETCARFNRFDNMLRHFAMAVRGEIQTPYTPERELATYKLLLKSCGVEFK